MSEKSDRELLEELGVETKGKKKAKYSAKEERIIAGFEDIQRFVEENGRLPVPGENKDIFERLYATRLLQIRKLPEPAELLGEIDHQGLLNGNEEEESEEDLGDEELLALLGASDEKKNDITTLKHVKPRSEIRAAEEIASREPCADFEHFKALFGTIQYQLKSGDAETRPFKDYADIRKGDLFILSGQIVYVAELGEEFTTEYNRKTNRLRVIYDNGTESDILLHSLQRALNKDPKGRRIVEQTVGPLFSDSLEEDDYGTGIIYVLRSNSLQPDIKENRKLLHKIGVTSGSVERRIANAKNDPTFLMAEVEIVASYQLYNIKSSKLEGLIHRFFDSARLDISITDRFGKPVSPREWFLVPLFVIEQFVEKLQEGSIQKYTYDPATASLVENK